MTQSLGRWFGWAHKYSFKRARAQFDQETSSSVVRIRNLKSSRDDGILYPDDKLSDVADDREQIIADFEEDFSPIPHYNCGDGTSTSSVCTGSPDLFSVEVSSHGSVQYAQSDVEITEESPPLGITPLQVRRGSEPALNSLCPSSPTTTDPSKRWSTAVVINPASPEKQKNSPDKSLPKNPSLLNGDSKQSSRNFSRGSGRLSILGNNPETYRWVEAADRQLMKDLNDKLTIKPLASKCSPERDAASDSSSTSEERERTIILKNESGPLGIHVVPDYDSNGRDTGLVIQGIEAGGRIDRDGRFCVGDRIVEINGQSLRSISFQAAQEVFKNALKTPQIKLELVRGSAMSNSNAATPRKPPPPVYPKPVHSNGKKKSDEESTLVEGEERVGGVTTKVATVTPTKKVPAVSTHRLATANTRKIGKKISIQLTKGTSGLGFSITTRDNPAGGSSPIYIKNVLPKGAAIDDGRLKPGDRLLEVNGIEMTGKSQSEAVQILRNTPLGGTVSLIVSRQEAESPQNSECETNSQASCKVEDEAGIFPWKHREILTFQIPLNDTGSAGLGVSVKGKSTAAASGSVDLGIFIKSIIAGGAASKDGRLQPNDQLVNINGISLLGMSNSNAMETLRKAMTQVDGPIPNNIILTIARRITQPPEEGDNNSVNSKISTANSQCSASVSSNNREENKVYQKDVSKSNDSYDSSLPSNSSTQLKDFVNGQSLDTCLPGCNPVIERLTGQTVNGPFLKQPSDSYTFNANNHGGQQHNVPPRTERNMPLYSPTICVTPCESVLIEGEYNTTVNNLKTVGSPEDTVLRHEINAPSGEVIPASSQLSLEEINAGFARDGFGRQSMSEKRHAQLDAKNTDTYQRNKKAREEREHSRQLFEQEYYMHHHQLSSQGKSDSQLSTLPVSTSADVPCGPSLGLRKSSSLESLQTMIQELNKDDEAMKKALQSTSTRGSRSRGCNESFRAAVDRSYEAPAPSTMETLDEESESGSSVGHILGRAIENSEAADSATHKDVFSEDILNLYCRSSKGSKKKSLLKGLGSVFKFGKSRKNMGDFKGKLGDEPVHDTENLPPHLSQPSSSKEQEKVSDHDLRVSTDTQKKPLPLVPQESASSLSESIPNRQERMQNLREQHQRLHQKRQGHYPLDQKEELYESEIQAKENQLSPSEEISHTRSHSHDEILNKVGNRPVFTEAGRYSHYMNYKEIQQHMTQYYHHEQVPKMTYAQNSSNCVPKTTVHSDRPCSNYFDYESVQQLHRHATNKVPETDTSSLPRGSHISEHSGSHMHAQANKHFYSHDFAGGYERHNMHHYYPNSNAVYSHVVPGSKV